MLSSSAHPRALKCGLPKSQNEEFIEVAAMKKKTSTSWTEVILYGLLINPTCLSIVHCLMTDPKLKNKSKTLHRSNCVEICSISSDSFMLQSPSQRFNWVEQSFKNPLYNCLDRQTEKVVQHLFCIIIFKSVRK